MSEEKKENQKIFKKRDDGYSLFNPVILQKALEKNIGPGVKHIMIFQNIEGSIIAKASAPSEIQQPQPLSMQPTIEGQEEPYDHQKSLNSYAAVLANICHEYIEFGLEAFDNNKFQ